MKQQFVAVLATAALSLAMAVPATAQSFFIPDYALPSASGMTGGFVAGGFARGIGDDSGEQSVFGGAVGGFFNRVTIMGQAGYVASDVEELTFGGAISVDILPPETSSLQVAIQGGFGYIDPGITLFRVPIGVAFKGNVRSESATVVPWAMPKIVITRAGDPISETETDFGASGGIGITLPSGIGFHGALDVMFEGDSSTPILFGVGVHYLFGGNDN